MEEWNALKASNPPLYQQQIAQLKSQLGLEFQKLLEEKPQAVEHFRKQFRKERSKYWKEKKAQYKDAFQAYLNSQRNLLYRQLEFLEFRKPEEYRKIMERIEKQRPAMLEDLAARNEKFTRAKQRIVERDERIRQLTEESEKQRVATQRRTDIVNKLRTRDQNRNKAS